MHHFASKRDGAVLEITGSVHGCGIFVTDRTGALAQSSLSCTNALVSMSPCLNYIQGNSSTPSSSCCSQLANVVSSQPRCLCQVLNGSGSSLGMDTALNQTQAMALPTACNVKTPPATQCNDSLPFFVCMDKGGGSKTVPTTGDGTSAGNSAKQSFPVVFFMAASSFVFM
ncbi:hypothetical protein GQ457_08G021230 [Hibiscus cannabinus]